MLFRGLSYVKSSMEASLTNIPEDNDAEIAADDVAVEAADIATEFEAEVVADVDDASRRISLVATKAVKKKMYASPIILV